mgnify:CR=1 FL=1
MTGQDDFRLDRESLSRALAALPPMPAIVNERIDALATKRR